MSKDPPATVFLRDYAPPPWLVDSIELHFELDEAATRVHARLAVRRNPQSPQGLPLALDGEGLDLRSLRVDGEEVPAGGYRVEGGRLVVDGPPERFELETDSLIHPRENTALEGLYLSGGIFCTQCEAQGFRRITWFPDRPDVTASFRTTIVADRRRCPVLLSNGNRVSHEELDGGRHRVTWEDPFRKPCYLFALVAGDLECVEDRFVTRSGRGVALRLYVERHNLDRCAHAMRSLQHAMRWDEQTFGLEYDLDTYMIVAVDDFNMGAMENKGLNVFNSKYVLARPDTATDSDFTHIEAVVGHEYFHNWTGNRVTLRDWFQLSLKEGLTVFREQEFSCDMSARAVKRIQDVRLLRTHQFAEDAGPMAHPVRPGSYVEISNFYTTTVYNKGAEVIRMIHTLLGADRFREGLALYLRRHDGQAVTTDDFVRAMEDAGGKDLGQFRRWYEQAGTPELAVRWHHDPGERTWTLRVRQSCPPTPGQPGKAPLHIPLVLGLLGPDGGELPLRLADEPPGAAATTRVLELRREHEEFRFVDVDAEAAPVPSLLRGFSAPVKLTGERAAAELAFLLAHDPDPFNRWDAGQELATREILARVQAQREDRGAEPAAALAEAFRSALRDERLDRALLAEALRLPSESLLAERMERIDVEGIHHAREHLRAWLAGELREAWLACYEAHRDAGPYRFDAEAAGRRSLKNLALGYLMALEEEQTRALCMRQFEEADNMTDSLAALALLADTDCPERETALAAFYERWRDDALVLDKWFAVQATSRLPQTLARVRELTAHPAFRITNPNRVRALIGAFCQGNPVRFHAADGGGYRFLGERVRELDPLNPQVAARLLGAFARWQRHEEPRRSLMQRELEGLLAVQDLSRDAWEVASKTLGVPQSPAAAG